jgi:hypothetical protein
MNSDVLSFLFISFSELRNYFKRRPISERPVDL